MPPLVPRLAHNIHEETAEKRCSVEETSPWDGAALFNNERDIDRFLEITR